MKVGIIGLPQTGKKTLFGILTGNQITDPSKTVKPVPGAADIVDSRFDALVSMYEPKKQVRARLDLVLLPKLEEETIAKGEIFRDIADMDAICHLVRAFEDESIYHAKGNVDPLRDIMSINEELLLHDQMFVEKRIERLESMIKKIKDENQEKELALLKKFETHLEEQKPLRLMEISPEEEKLIRSYPFITRKKMVIAVNVGEQDLDTAEEMVNKFKETCTDQDIAIMAVSAKLEAEIALLDSEEEKQEFLNDLGIKNTALETLTRLCLDSLRLISFFTVGKDEVRQWLVKDQSTAPQAAGVIHSDLERGFIRAEVFSYADLMEFGSEAELKKNGKFNVEGKDYMVKDADIINIRFSV